MAYWLMGYREAETLEREEKGEGCDGVLAYGDIEGRRFGNVGLCMVLCKVWLVVGDGKMWYDGE